MTSKLSPRISMGKPLFTNDKFEEKVREPKKFSKTMVEKRRSPSSFFEKLEVNTTPIIPNRLSDQSARSTKSPGARSILDDKENSQDEEDPISQNSPKKRLSFEGRSPEISKKKISALSENVPLHECEEESDFTLDEFDMDDQSNENSSLEDDSSKPTPKIPKILWSLNLSPVTHAPSPSLLKSPKPKQTVSKASLTTPIRNTTTEKNSLSPARQSPRNKVSNTVGKTATKSKDNPLQRSMEIQAGSTHVNRIHPERKNQQIASAIPKRLTRSKCEAFKDVSIASFIKKLNKTLDDSSDIDSILLPAKSHKRERPNQDSSPKIKTKTTKKVARPRKVQPPSNDTISSKNIHFDIKKSGKDEIPTMLSNSVPLPESEDVTIAHNLSTTLNKYGKRRKKRKRISMPTSKQIKIKRIVRTTETTTETVVKDKSLVDEIPSKSMTKRKNKTVRFAPEPKGNTSSNLPTPNVLEYSSEIQTGADDEKIKQVTPSINRSQSKRTISPKKRLTPYPLRKKKNRSSDVDDSEDQEESDNESEKMDVDIDSSPHWNSKQIKSQKKFSQPYHIRLRRKRESSPDDGEANEEKNEEENDGESSKMNNRRRPKKKLNQEPLKKNQKRRSPLKKLESIGRKETDEKDESDEEDESGDDTLKDTKNIFENEKLSKKKSRMFRIKKPKENKYFKPEKITVPPYDVEFKSNGKNDNYTIYRYFDVPNARVGHIMLLGGKDKGWNRVKNDTLVFYVLKGPLQVHIFSEQWTAITGEFFYIPNGCDYNLVNPTSEDCRLLFCSGPIREKQS